jgi:hypothetical protein
MRDLCANRMTIPTIPQAMHTRSRGVCRPSFSRTCRPPENRGRREGRELASPMARLQQKTQAAGTTGSAQDIPTLPARWSYELYALFPGTGCLAPVVCDAASASSQNLASAPGCQNHATSSSHRIVRPHGNHATTRRAHRIPHPTSVTTAKRPLCGTGCADQTTISDKWKEKYFCGTGWTG